MPRIIEKELSYEIVGLCMKTHKRLGQFASERQYCDDFELLLKETRLPYGREFEIKLFESSAQKGNRVDFFIGNKLLVDFKAKPFITKEDYYQMQRYLKAANLELGLIINFRAYRLSPKRVLNSSYSGHLDTNSDN